MDASLKRKLGAGAVVARPHADHGDAGAVQGGDPGERFAQPGQTCVADRVAIGVVVELEAIGIHEEERGVAASGDLGYTTGPWSYKKNAGDEEATAFGQFVSIWRREGGKWKLLFDLGSQNPKPTELVPSLHIVDLKSPAGNSNSPSARAAFFQRDREYATAVQPNFSAAAAEDVTLT